MWCENGRHRREFFDRELASAEMVDVRAGTLASCERKSYGKAEHQDSGLPWFGVRPLANRLARHKTRDT